MAFNRKDKEDNDKKDINKALEEAQSPDLKNTNLNILKKNSKEKKARFQFTLEPTVRKKIEKLAKDNGYSSSSEFLNELIKNI